MTDSHFISSLPIKLQLMFQQEFKDTLFDIWRRKEGLIWKLSQLIESIK